VIVFEIVLRSSLQMRSNTIRILGSSNAPSHEGLTHTVRILPVDTFRILLTHPSGPTTAGAPLAICGRAVSHMLGLGMLSRQGD
jgi:hypothetical protein